MQLLQMPYVFELVPHMGLAHTTCLSCWVCRPQQQATHAARGVVFPLSTSNRPAPMGSLSRAITTRVYEYRDVRSTFAHALHVLLARRMCVVPRPNTAPDMSSTHIPWCIRNITCVQGVAPDAYRLLRLLTASTPPCRIWR